MRSKTFENWKSIIRQRFSSSQGASTWSRIQKWPLALAQLALNISRLLGSGGSRRSQKYRDKSWKKIEKVRARAPVIWFMGIILCPFFCFRMTRGPPKRGTRRGGYTIRTVSIIFSLYNSANQYFGVCQTFYFGPGATAALIMNGGKLLTFISIFFPLCSFNSIWNFLRLLFITCLIRDSFVYTCHFVTNGYFCSVNKFVWLKTFSIMLGLDLVIN